MKRGELIGEGSGRIVSGFSRNKVIKVAKNEAGRMQNKIEANVPRNDRMCARVSQIHPDHDWIVMDYAPVVSKEEFERHTGFKQEIFRTFIHYHFFVDVAPNPIDAANIDKDLVAQIDFKAMRSNRFCKKLIDFAYSNRLSIMDLTRHDAWGISKLNDSLVLFDYGLTQEIYQNYYTVLDRDYSTPRCIYKKGCVVPNEFFMELKSKSK